MNYRKILITVLALTYFHYPRGFAQSEPAFAKLLHQYLTTQHQRMGFSGVVMVSADQQIIYRDSVGLASNELNVPIAPKSVFRVASITKQFLAAHLGKMPGSYVTENGMKLNISLSGDQLYAKLGGNPAFGIYPEAPFQFYGKKVAVALHFRADDQGIVTRVEAEGKGQKLTFKKQ